MNAKLPPQLIRAVEEGRCILFLGAGCSLNASLPSSHQLASILYDELRKDYHKDEEFIDKIDELEAQKENLSMIAELHVKYYRNKKAYQIVVDEIAKSEKTANADFMKKLVDITSISEIITTNYDLLVENAYDAEDMKVIYKPLDIRQETGPRVSLIKLHGTRTDVESMVLTKDDYRRFFARKEHEALIDYVKTLIRQKTIIAVGYSLEDENFGTIYSQAVESFRGSDRLDYFVAPKVSLYQSLSWAREGFKHIPLSAEDFISALSSTYEKETYGADTAYIKERKINSSQPLNNPFVFFDTEAVIEERPKFLFDTFIPPVMFPDILTHQTTFIEGHRGSGKSMILWRMSLMARTFGGDQDLPMWGFYIKMVPGFFADFRRRTSPDSTYIDNRDKWTTDFIHYFNLILFDGILDNILKGIQNNIITPKVNLSTQAYDISRRLLRYRGDIHVDSVQKLRFAVQEEIDTIRADRDTLSFRTSFNFLPRCLESLTEAIPSLSIKWWHILLDEYDRLDADQQAVVNILLSERHPKLRFKIAVKTLHAYLKDVDGNSLDKTHDFGYIPCDSFIWDKAYKKDYIKFLEEISNKRLDISDYKQWKIRQVLPNSDKDTEPYSGFEKYCLLASGLTRHYLELCKDAFYEAFPESVFKRPQTIMIPPRIQNHVAKIHSALLFKNYHSTKEPSRILKLFKVMGPLFYGIAKVTSEQTEYRTPLSFEISDLDNLKHESLEVLEEAIRNRLIQLPLFPKSPHNPLRESPAQKYSLNRMLAPFFKLDLTERYPVSVKGEDINAIWERADEVLRKLSKPYRNKGIDKYLEMPRLPMFGGDK